jgi:hypothetical protein
MGFGFLVDNGPRRRRHGAARIAASLADTARAGHYTNQMNVDQTRRLMYINEQLLTAR